MMVDTVEPAGQRWSAEGYARNARFVADLGLPVVTLLDPRPGERILDLGCGDGALTAKLVAAGADVTGCDASPDLVAAAVALGLRAVEVDAHALAFERAFDAVFTNAALHWMTRPDEVVAGVVRALKPGGRFVGEFGGHANVAAIRVALIAVLERRGVAATGITPWYFPTADAYRAKLERHGFAVDHIALIPRPTPLPTGMDGWLNTFGEPYLRHLPVAERDDALAEAVALLAPVLRAEDGSWHADYVRLRFRATLANDN